MTREFYVSYTNGGKYLITSSLEKASDLLNKGFVVHELTPVKTREVVVSTTKLEVI